MWLPRYVKMKNKLWGKQASPETRSGAQNNNSYIFHWSQTRFLLWSFTVKHRFVFSQLSLLLSLTDLNQRQHFTTLFPLLNCPWPVHSTVYLALCLLESILMIHGLLTPHHSWFSGLCLACVMNEICPHPFNTCHEDSTVIRAVITTLRL